MSKLSDLQQFLPGATRRGTADPEIRGVAYDSRRVNPGDLFVCVAGFKRDGRRFLADAVARGAVAALVEPAPDAEPGAVSPDLPTLVVPSARRAMALAAAAFHDHPSRRLCLVGVTGTNGKTTTTHLIESLFRAVGQGTGVIGTLGARIRDRALPEGRTTPEAPDLQSLIGQMVAEDVAAVTMEVSSHALVLGRTLGCEYDFGVFTNLTQDHLDFHETFEDYFDAKATLFRDYPKHSAKHFTGIINLDDPWGARLAALCAGDVLTYGIESAAHIRAAEIRATPAGIEFRVSVAGAPARPVRLRLGGHFNVYNALAAMGVGVGAGIPWETIVAGLEGVPGVPGRFEAVDAGQNFAVLVDYAHTPDGLLNVLRAARALSPRRLIAVFGCGGDRDRTKRPIMGRIAAEHADVAVVTSDNPRSEDPDEIIAEILVGMKEDDRPPTTDDRSPSAASAIGGLDGGRSSVVGRRASIIIEPDRRAAIERAIRTAEPGDLVLIAGKGHEDYQIFADRTIHFDDREVAREALRARANS
jgi:UDP-N-acetylmuramoyl-L-alanyl-D-glutamate--2,6-diaminopimelate ligase